MKTSSFKSSNSKSIAKSTPIPSVPSNFKLTAKPLSTLIINSEAGKRQLTGAEHWGIDLKATSDTNIFATHNAVVIKAGWSDNCNETITNRGYGRTLVLMDEETKMLTLYAHLSSYLVNKGDHVIAGQTIIAKSGNSGHSNGAHLHFEVIDGNVGFNGNPIWQQIKNSPNGITTFSKGKGGTLGVNNDVGRFNPRLLLADLALDLARQELGSQATEEQIETRSCSIFSCDVVAQPASISLQGDRRANIFTRANGNVKSLEFRFPDVSKIGKDVIDVKEVIGAGGKTTVSKLMLEDQEVTYQTSKCSCVAESDLTVVSNKWVINHNGKNYNLKRVNEEGQIDSAGKDLMIIPSSDTSDQNIIKIKNFNFDRIRQKDAETEVGDFGVDIEILGNEVLVSNVTQPFPSYRPIITSTVTGLMDGNFVITWNNMESYFPYIYYKIFGQIFDSSGNKIGDGFEILGQDEGENYFAIKGLTNGGFVVLYHGETMLENEYNDFTLLTVFQVFDAFGNKIGNKVEVENNLSPYSIIPLFNGGFALVAQIFNINAIHTDYGYLCNSDRIVAQFFNANGNKVSDTLQLNSECRIITDIYNVARCFDCNIIAEYEYEVPLYLEASTPASNGKFIVTWIGYELNNGYYSNRIIAQILDQSGNKIGGEFFISPDYGYYGYVDSLKSISLTNGRFMVAWRMQKGSPLTEDGVCIQIFDQNGNKVNNEFFVYHNNFYTNNVYITPTNYNIFTVVPLNNGEFAISFLYGISFSYSTQPFITRIFDQDGNKINEFAHMYATISLNNGNFILGASGIDQVFNSSGIKVGRKFSIIPSQLSNSLSIVPLDNSKFVTSWITTWIITQNDFTNDLTKSIFAKIYDSNHPTCNSLATISSSTSPQSILLQQDVIHIASGNQDTFTVPAVTGSFSITYQIGNFRSNGNDVINLSNLASLASFGKKDETNKSGNLQVSAFARNGNTVIAIRNANVEIILMDYDVNNFRPEYLIGSEVNITLETITIQNPNQSPTYTQLDATINLQDIRINATNPQAIIEASLTLLDNDGNIISDPNDLLIQIGETDSGTISTFNNGTWQANGTVTEVNDLLSNLTLELGQSFEESFNIDVAITYNGNQILHTTSEIFVDYQCQSLTPEIQELIDSQTTNEGREIILDLARYFYDPNNPDDIARLVFNIQQRIAESDLKQDSCLDIQRLNQTAFAIISNCQGIYNLTAIAQNQCQDQEYQDFDFIVDNSPSSSALPIFSTTSSVSRTNAVSNTRSVLVSSSALPNFSTENSPSVTNSAPNQDQASANNDALLIGLITAGGSLLLIAALCYLYKKSSAIKEYFNHHTQNNNIEGTQIQLPTIGECLDYHNRNTQMQPRSNVRPVSANVHQGSTQTHSQVPL